MTQFQLSSNFTLFQIKKNPYGASDASNLGTNHTAPEGDPGLSWVPIRKCKNTEGTF